MLGRRQWEGEAGGMGDKVKEEGGKGRREGRKEGRKERRGIGERRKEGA